MSRFPLTRILRTMSTCKPPPTPSKCPPPCPPPAEEIIYGPSSYHPYPEGGHKIYKRIFFLLCVPAVAVTAVCTFCDKEEPERPEFVKYSYLRLRTKRYPWGDGNKTFFHNPRTNALPDGYEDEE
ncbi:hypothetical protein PPYR_13313 [Photinus pyralis]|uniref:Cytochrome c oxidase subunit n=1 Tax=Photinus pyralis TaxID=7054 RepID=A0A1Y1ND77_PHOPY|nr:cytochrome c oxidase subunit 6A1, mitochondrial-like [Photinus pyralis]KAB0793693.1 hypothetical protein PPYR_13313 [Photinus pyralis]